MSLIKLSCINKGGHILLHSEQSVFIETEAKTATVHMTEGLLFSVEETPAAISERIEQLESARNRNAIVVSRLVTKPAG